ncbi:MAG TPA: hypothetical protein VII56_10595 [Rhizomicrobium sp.]
MKTFATGLALIAALSFVPVQSAQAKGCIKGAVAGGIAGHLLHHHAILGAIAGCAIGHHIATQNARAAHHGHH